MPRIRNSQSTPSQFDPFMKRTFVIGDVHGCSTELEALLKRLEPAKEDAIVFLGDMINRGPDSHGVLEIIRKLPNARCLLGNHEARLIRYHREGDAKILKDFDWDTLRQLDKADWDTLDNLLLTLYLEEYNTLLVHGGFLPNTPWQEQGEAIVTRIQTIDSKGRPAKRTECPEGTFWADMWKGPPFVIYGHTPRESVYHKPWSLGLDTGCVYGGHLTACILPGREIIQVPARAKY
jgi:serine/threonine protein phosphatase 1